MLTFLRRFLILLLGIVLIALPVVVRDLGWRYNERNYTPPDVPELNFAATPALTPTARAVIETVLDPDDGLRRGPVVVDFAHFGFLNPANLQPLAAALADRGIGLRYWISQVDTMALESSAQFPDQSTELAAQLKDASALIVVSPFFLWTAQEIALVERFVADGGRLLMASDPDIMGDYPSILNILAEPFGVVFNDDYLYDTTRNDGNFTFFFVESASARADAPSQDTATAGTTDLADATIAFYGGRSISGAVTARMRSVDTTASSLRTGQSAFITVAIGGVAGRGTQGRVLALSDFDVLTEAYRVRHDNQRMVEFVADFLSADQRIQTMADFPGYLGKAVALAYGARSAIDAELLAQGAQLQERLEATGRTLTLTNGHVLSNTTAGAVDDGKDLIYLADYTTALAKTTLLTDLGIQVITEAVTITIPVAPAVVSANVASPQGEADDTADAPEADSEETGSDVEESAAVTSTTATTVTSVTITRTNSAATTPEPLTVTATITKAGVMTDSVPETRVEITTYLETIEGLRLLADEMVLVAQSERANGSLLLAVLGADRRGIDAGVTRLLANDFSDCVIGEVITFCSLPPEDKASDSRRDSGQTGESEPSDDRGDDGSEPRAPPTERTGILLIDDNRAQRAPATPSERSEADLYLQTLVAGGHSVDLWSVNDQGTPTAEDMSGYAWVIWSNAGYAAGKLSIEDMDLVFGYIRLGGRLTVSSRFPLPGIEEASAVRDLVIDSAIPTLVEGLPAEPIPLAEEQSAANLTPLTADESGVEVAMRRGPESTDAEAPVLVVLTNAAEGDSNARFMIVGMALTGLPEEEGTTLINNMATWMLAE